MFLSWVKNIEVGRMGLKRMKNAVIDLSRVWLVVTVLGLCACGGEPAPLLPMFNLCETSADCSELTPECRSLDLSGSGASVSVCTAVCGPDDEGVHRACPGNPDVGFEIFACLGVNSQGHLDASSSERLCVAPCSRTEWLDPEFSCFLGGTRGGGVCALLEYDEMELQYICLEPGTELPPPIIPTFNTCESPIDCSELTPDCRQFDPFGNGAVGSWCTRICEADSECPTAKTSQGVASGRCVGVDAEGRINFDATEKVCFQGCFEDGRRCMLGQGHPEIEPRYGACGPTVWPVTSEEDYEDLICT
jgi:hypothetical protein